MYGVSNESYFKNHSNSVCIPSHPEAYAFDQHNQNSSSSKICYQMDTISRQMYVDTGALDKHFDLVICLGKIYAKYEWG